MVINLELVHKFFFIGVAVLFLFQSVILYVRGKNNKARLTMSALEFLWGVVYVFSFVMMCVMNPPEQYSLFREKVLVLGSYYISFILFLPVQVFLPGWLNLKRFILLELPIVVTTLIYYVGMYLLGESPENPFTYAELAASLSHFNIWFRFVMLFSNLIYFIYILKWIYGYEKKYNEWKNENFSNLDYVDVSWMRAYIYLMIGIFIFYMGVLVFGGRISVLCHCSFVICSFSYLFYKSLFYESPYPEDFFAGENGAEAKIRNENIYVISPTPDSEKKINERSFEMKIQSYVDTVKVWLEAEKPYLYKDFKLTDVSRVLPLNRSYLSRVFNEGFGTKFSEVVCAYRVEYSKEVILKDPALPLYTVAEICGFSSDSSYIRAFKKITGITPKQFKTNIRS